MPSITLFVLCRNVRLLQIAIQLYSAHIVLCMYLGILSIILQSEAIEKLPEGQQTFAILADAFRIDVYQARLQLFPEFIVKKRDWIEKVSAPLLGVKKRSIDDYLAEFLNPNMPLDEIGILLFSRMMHKHVVVFFNDLYWTTRSDNDITKCDCYLSYRGKCKYVNTVQLTKEEWNTRKDYLKAFEQMWFFDNPPRDCTMQDQKPVIGTVQKIDPALQDVAETFDVDIEKPKRKPKKKHKNLRKEKPTRRSQRLKEQDDRLNSSILSSLHSTTPKPHQTRNSLKSEAELRKAKNLLSNAKKSRGKFDIDNFVLKKRKRKRKPVKCSACQQVFSSHKKLTQHVKDDHPEFKYSCRYCPKKFESASWKYQHQARHKGLKFKCSVDSCGKLFQFGYQYRDHQKKHTRKGLYLCSTRDCGRVFTTKRARTFHKKNTASQKRPLFVDLKHLMMLSHVQKNSKGRLTVTNI